MVGRADKRSLKLEGCDVCDLESSAEYVDGGRLERILPKAVRKALIERCLEGGSGAERGWMKVGVRGGV
jgi:hypothetical protein